MTTQTDTKWCSRCKTTKPIVDFGVNRGRRDGLTVYCVECGRAATTASRLAKRREAVARLGGKCVECGYDKDERALQFDHVHSDGKHDRTVNGSGPKFFRAIIAGEMDGRVQLLCANCNQIKVWEAGERGGKRDYVREVPTVRIDRPNQRWTPEQRAAQAAKSRQMWDDPEKRAAVVAAQTQAGQDPALRAIRSRAASENMTRRWASGEVPNRPAAAATT